MKFLLIPVLTITLLAASLPSGHPLAYAANSPQIVINGQVAHTEQPLFIENNELFAPVKVVFGQLGFTVEWNEELQAVIGTKHHTTIQLKPSNSIAFVNKLVTKLKAAPRMVNGSLYIPVTAVAEALGQEVIWSELTQTIFVKSDLTSQIMDILELGEHLSYEGESRNGLKHGTGILYYEGQEWYRGEFKHNELSGVGQLYRDGQLVYQGSFAHNAPQGSGTLFYSNGRRFTGQFDKGKPHGHGSLYVYDALVYTGQWSNGQMDGLGKLYNKDGLIYDGYLKNNQRSGTGIEFAAGKKVYAGAWRNDVREGSGKLFDTAGKLIYDGSWSNNQKHGAGVSYKSGKTFIYSVDSNNKATDKKETPYVDIAQETYLDGKLLQADPPLVYMGEFDESGIPHGKGTLSLSTPGDLYDVGTLWHSLTMYEGDFRDGRMTGYGKLYDADEQLIYEGQINDGLRSGTGRAYRNGVIAYEGSWKNDLENGIGRTYEYESGSAGANYTGIGTAYMHEGVYKQGKLIEPGNIYRYSGDFVGGSPEGYGTLVLLYAGSSTTKPTLPLSTNTSGILQYEGAFLAGVKHGSGKQYENGILLYHGSFKNNERHGKGTLYQDNLTYDGTFEHNSREGSFVVTNSYRYKVFEGTYRNNSKNGQGKAYDDFGKLVYEGGYVNDQRSGFGKLYDSSGRIYYQGEFRGGQTITEYMDSLKRSN